MIRLIPLLLPLACSGKDGPSYLGDYQVGDATVCLDDGTGAPGDREETETWDITGKVYLDAEDTLDGNLHPCGEVVRVLTIVGDDRTIYELGYGLHDQHDVDLTPALDVGSGDVVYLHFVSVQSFGDAAGFVLLDNDSVIAAVENGTWGPALEADSFPGLTVALGDPAGGARTDCGSVDAYELAFIGDAERDLTPVEDQLITVAGTAYDATALAAWDYSDATCTDVAGATVWAAFR